MWQTFIGEVVVLAGNAKQLRLSNSSTTFDTPQNRQIVSSFPELEKLEFEGNLRRQNWINDWEFITLPKLRSVVINLDAKGMEQFPRIRILPFNAPALEEFTLNSSNLFGELQYLQMSVSVFIVDSNHPNSSNITSLYFTDPYLTLDLSGFGRRVKLHNLTTLHCNLETAASLTPFIQKHTTLALVHKRMPKRRLPNKEYKKCVNFLNDLARSTTLVSIGFGGWGWQGKDFDIYLSEKRRILSEQRGKLDHLASLAQPLRHLSMHEYPKWSILVDILRRLHEQDPKSQIQSIKLPGIPHPSILVAIADAFKGSCTDEMMAYHRRVSFRFADRLTALTNKDSLKQKGAFRGRS
jgi:hypothetical protein